MKGLPKMVLTVEEGDMSPKLQDIRRIVKQRGKSERRETIVHARPAIPARVAHLEESPADSSKRSSNKAAGEK
jgi:hypothetical protein